MLSTSFSRIFFNNGIDLNNKTLHLGVFIEPFLTKILIGKKVWESRFSINRCPPYQRVNDGDILLIKKSGGPILGYSEIENVIYLELDTLSFDDLKQEYSELLCIEDPLFWETKRLASYMTIMKLSKFQKISPIDIVKRDRRGWVVLKPELEQFKLAF
ncbi:MAG: hypothetical protein Q8N03_05770 [Ignavibacteria bacterium]|nr:hypothetical protein [Ignavibacteria bacterium]